MYNVFSSNDINLLNPVHWNQRMCHNLGSMDTDVYRYPADMDTSFSQTIRYVDTFEYFFQKIIQCIQDIK
jgi:hypothetical protein